MHSPPLAIAWEIWRKNRWALVVVLAAIPASFLLQMLLGPWIPEMVKIWEFLLILLSLIIVFWSFCFTEMDAQGRHLGFPSRMFVLPVRTWKLVSYPVFFGTGGILLFYFVWSGVIWLEWGVLVPRGIMLCHAGLLAAMMVSMQAIVWALHRFNWTRMIALGAVGSLLGGIGVIDIEYETWLSRRALAILSGTVMLAAYFSALWAVDRDRRGEWLGGLERFYQRIFDVLPWRRTPFTSFPHAQFWMEWRRRGWWMAGGMAVMMVFSLALLPMATALYLDSTMTLLSFTGLPIAALWCAASAGMHLAKSDLWSPDLALHPITSMRPISTGEVVLAKLRVAAAVTVLAWVLLAVFAWPAMQAVRGLADLNQEVILFWAKFPANHAALTRWASNPVVILTALGVTWHAMVQGMCPALAGRPRKNIWAVGLGLFLFGIVVMTAHWLYRHPHQLPAALAVLPWITTANLIWKWASAARAFTKTARRNYYSQKQCRALLGIWMGLTAGVAASAVLACLANQIPVPIILFLAVWLLPGGELASCAENLAQNRHR